MKKYGKLGAYGLIFLGVFALISGISHASVYLSKHDLSATSGGSALTFQTDEVCVFCHTPHGASMEARNYAFYNTNISGYINTGTGSPILLWNRPLSNAAAQEGYLTYQSSSLNADMGTGTGQVQQVRIYSLMCLSCHDGVGALNVLTTDPVNMIDTDSDGNPDPTQEPFQNFDQIGDVFPNSYGGGPNIGNRVSPEHTPPGNIGPADLRNDHPISIDYDADLVAADQGLNDPNGIDTALKLFPRPGTGAQTSIECSTCHNPHEQGDVFAGTEPFLVMTMDGSQLCLECHNK